MDLRHFSDLPKVALVRETLRKWWGLELSFADGSGYVLDHAEGKIIPSNNGFCERALFSKEGFRRCNDSIRLVSELLRNREAGVVVHSCHLGFDVVAAPIRLANELLGFVFAGGAFATEPPERAKTDLFAKVGDFSSDSATDLSQSLDEVARLSGKDLQYLKDLVNQAARAVTEALPKVRIEKGSAPKFPELIGSSGAMRSMTALLEKIVRSESTVLIHGESGTGKELIARAIHYNGPRAKKPFVVQNCSAFNDNLLESTLFGHMRGAFTGAVKDTKGLFEVADGGTFFLDEIGDMSAALQVKLLRVLQEGILTPVGATKPIKVNVRIIAASHKDLSKLVERNEFREDLYYRINVLRISVPALRERLDDLVILVDHFLKKHGGERNPIPTLSKAALEALARYHWPGNVRELENEIERLLVLTADLDEIPADLISQRILDGVQPELPRTSGGTTLRELVEKVEAEAITQGLVRTHWNKSQLAKELGISRSSLIQKCIYYGLDRKD